MDERIRLAIYRLEFSRSQAAIARNHCSSPVREIVIHRIDRSISRSREFGFLHSPRRFPRLLRRLGTRYNGHWYRSTSGWITVNYNSTTKNFSASSTSQAPLSIPLLRERSFYLATFPGPDRSSTPHDSMCYVPSFPTVPRFLRFTTAR